MLSEINIVIKNFQSQILNIFGFGLDRESMIALSLGKYPPRSAKDAAEIEIPTLIISGEKDMVLGTGQKVAQSAPQGEYLEIKDTNHFELAIDKNVHHSTIGFYLKNENNTANNLYN